MALTSFDQYLARAAAFGNDCQPIYGQYQTATSTALLGGVSVGNVFQRGGFTKAVPNPLPTGVTSYNIASIVLAGSAQAAASIVKQINLGTITFGNSTATFSAGSTMPTVTQGNTASVQTSGIIMAEVTTVLSATPGSITINYTNQAGAAKSTASLAATASAVLGTCQVLPLAAGDYGVRQVNSITPSGVGATQSGVITLWGIIPICTMNTTSGTGGYPTVRDFLTSSMPPIRLGAGDQVGIFQAQATARALFGYIEYVGGS